jgi:hypothetical protein
VLTVVGADLTFLAVEAVVASAVGADLASASAGLTGVERTMALRAVTVTIWHPESLLSEV